MKDLSLHILDIAENSILAMAEEIRIQIIEDLEQDTFTLIIKDDGNGMSPETAARVEDPFFTTKKGKKAGLGLSLLGHAARQTGGRLTIDSEEGKGTQTSALFKKSHPDMKPTGDIIESLATLIAGNPSVRFIYDSNENGEITHFDTEG